MSNSLTNYKFNYTTKINRIKFTFTLVFKDNRWISYISKFPKNKRIAIDPDSVYIAFDSKTNMYYIYWSSAIKSNKEMEKISAIWAEKFQRYFVTYNLSNNSADTKTTNNKYIIADKSLKEQSRVKHEFFHKRYERILQGGFVRDESELRELAALVWNNVDESIIEWIICNNLINKVLYCVPKAPTATENMKLDYSEIQLPGFSTMMSLFIPSDGYRYCHIMTSTQCKQSLDEILKHGVLEDPDMVLVLSGWLNDRFSLYKRCKNKA